MKKKALTLALAGIGAAALLGSSTGCGGGGGGDEDGVGGEPQLFANVLVRVTSWLGSFSPARSDYLILGTDGSTSRLSRNDAADRDLTNVLSCPNGNAILKTADNTYYFFDAQNKEIRFLAWTNVSSTIIYNENREPVGIRSGGSFGSNGLLVAYCNGQFVVNNNCSGTSPCDIYADMTSNTVVAVNQNTGTIYSIKHPSDLVAAFVVDGSNLQESVSVNEGNSMGVDNASPNWAGALELDSENRVVALLLVDLQTGSVYRQELPNQPVDVTPATNDTASPNTLLMREDGNNLYIAITRTFHLGARIWYGKFDGSQLTEISLVTDLDGDTNTTEWISDIDMDGKGNLYYIESNNQNTIRSVATDGTTGSASAAANFNLEWLIGMILPLEDGVVLSYGAGPTYTTYKAGGNSLTDVQAGSEAEKAAQNCANGWILQYGDLTTTCFDSGAGQNEVSYLPDANTANWKLVNPDGANTDNALDPFDFGIYQGSTLYVRDSQHWYKCPVNQTSCSRLTNVTVADTHGYSSTPRVEVDTTVGYISVVDLIEDSITTFNWSYPGVDFVVSGDLKKAAFTYAEPTSRCDTVGEGNVIVTEDITRAQNDPNAQTYTSTTVFEDPILDDPANTNPSFRCISSVLSVWTEDQLPSNQQQ